MFLMFCFSISAQTIKELVDVCLSALNSFKIAYFRPCVWPRLFLLVKSSKFSLFWWLFKYIMRTEHVLFLALLCSE
jgi:hypothetical protein